MMKLFLDPNKPLATCLSDTCDGCAVSGHLHCHFRLKDLVHFLLIAFPPFLLGGAGINRVDGWYLIPWVLFLIAFFGFVEIRVMCSHCPHYAEDVTSLKCWANYGSPKWWKYRPGPMTHLEKTIFFVGFATVWGYPLPFLVFGRQLSLMTISSMATCGFFMTLNQFLCTRCINFACPLNRVDEKLRNEFFTRNPSIAKAWGKMQVENQHER